jgi:hypothetical protein
VPKIPASFAVFVLFAPLLGCRGSSEPRSVAGIYIPSHEGDFLLSCDGVTNRLVLGNDQVLAQARVVAERGKPSSAYVEGTVEEAKPIESGRLSRHKHPYRFTKVTFVSPAPGKCPPLPKPAGAANNSSKPTPLRGAA